MPWLVYLARKLLEVVYFIQNNIKSGTSTMHQHAKILMQKCLGVKQMLQTYMNDQNTQEIKFYDFLPNIQNIGDDVKEENDLEDINASGKIVFDRIWKEVVIAKKLKIS